MSTNNKVNQTFTPEQRKRRIQKMKEWRERKGKEGMALYMKKWREERTPEQKAAKNAKAREYIRKRRANQTPEQRAKYNERQRLHRKQIKQVSAASQAEDLEQARAAEQEKQTKRVWREYARLEKKSRQKMLTEKGLPIGQVSMNNQGRLCTMSFP